MNTDGLTREQVCPHCGYVVDDSQAEWEEGGHIVECCNCNKTYCVTTRYKFLGFEIEKYCEECFAPISECGCEEESE